MAEVAASVVAVHQEVGALRTEINARLDNVGNSASRFDRGLSDVEDFSMRQVSARLDSILQSVSTTNVDIQGLALDFDRANDRVYTSLAECQSRIYEAVQDSHKTTSDRIDGLSKAIIDANSRSKHAFFEIGHGIDVNHQALLWKLDNVNRDLNLTDSNKIDGANSSINKLVVESRDHLHGVLDQVQQEVESSRRRISEKLNNMHEALAGILNTTRDSLVQKMERVAALLGSILPLLRSTRMEQKT